MASLVEPTSKSFYLCSVDAPSGWSLRDGLGCDVGLVWEGASTKHRGSTTQRAEREKRSNSDGEIR